MRAITITTAGGPEVLQLTEVPDPVPGPNEVLIDVAATAINRADLLQRAGNYPVPPGASPYPGLECSGRISALGPGDTGEWKVGDEVCALLAGGGYAEKVAVPAPQVLPIPKGLDLATAASLPEVACTVWSNIFAREPLGRGRLEAGESMLVHGGASGIGTLAIQLAVATGARAFATAGTADKVARCEELGAEVGINYRDEDFVERVKAVTADEGVNVVLDIIGAKYLAQNLEVLATGGRLVIIGMQGGRKGDIDLSTISRKRLVLAATGLRPRPVEGVEGKGAIIAGVRREVWPLIESGKVKPVIDRVLPLVDVPEAHRAMEASEHVGKIVLTV